MKIIYRIAGFEGEATENRIEKLGEEEEEIEEEKYILAKAINEDFVVKKN
jgi:hypothetical protein